MFWFKEFFMKKVTDFLRPNLLIVLGALWFLLYLNSFSSNDGGTIAIGVYGVIVAAYLMTIGVLSVVLGEKLNQMTRKIFEVIAVGLFGMFMFVNFLIMTIQTADFMGPTAWIIKILSMIAALGLIGIYIPARFANQKVLVRFAYLFSAIFALALLLDLLFQNNGGAAQLDDIPIVLAVAYALFVIYLFGTLGKDEPAPAPVAKEEPKQVEEQPEEEAAPEAE